MQRQVLETMMSHDKHAYRAWIAHYIVIRSENRQRMTCRISSQLGADNYELKNGLNILPLRPRDRASEGATSRVTTTRGLAPNVFSDGLVSGWGF